LHTVVKIILIIDFYTGLNVSNISPFDISKRKTFNSTNHIRFSRRNSIRVVLNNTSTKHDVKDTPFLEAFGISTKNVSNSNLLRKYFYFDVHNISLFFLS